MYCKFIAKDQTDANTLGMVIVYQSNGTHQTFDGIRRADFFQWRAKGYQGDCAGIRIKTHANDATDLLDASNAPTQADDPVSLPVPLPDVPAVSITLADAYRVLDATNDIRRMVEDDWFANYLADEGYHVNYNMLDSLEAEALMAIQAWDRYSEQLARAMYYVFLHT